MPSSDTEQLHGDSKRAKISAEAPAATPAEETVAKPAPQPTTFYQTETDVGITEFITPGWKGFDAVIKHRFCDFLVNEIDLSGRVVHLTSFTDADDPAPPKDEDDLEVPEDPKEAFEEAFKHLAEILGAEDAQHIRALLESGEDTEAAFVLERELDKHTRTRIYGVTNNFLPTRVSVNTQDGQMVFKRLPPNSKPKSGRRRWEHVGEFCHFVMQKENRDSMDILNQLAKLLRVKPGCFGMAGTKDKRGVTVQKCSSFKIEHSRLIWASLKLQGARLGNFSYAPRDLSLGDLAGNQFQIVLRYVEGADPVSLQPVLDGITNTGFINYFGMQRFGNSSVPSQAVGIEVLKANWQKA
ncbi:multisubstrate pseudouridine synthase 7, partial [Linderina pennispora]